MKLLRAALKRAGCKTVFKDEGLSGATIKRPALARCITVFQAFILRLTYETCKPLISKGRRGVAKLTLCATVASFRQLVIFNDRWRALFISSGVRDQIVALPRVVLSPNG